MCSAHCSKVVFLRDAASPVSCSASSWLLSRLGVTGRDTLCPSIFGFVLAVHGIAKICKCMCSFQLACSNYLFCPHTFSTCKNFCATSFHFYPPIHTGFRTISAWLERPSNDRGFSTCIDRSNRLTQHLQQATMSLQRIQPLNLTQQRAPS